MKLARFGDPGYERPAILDRHNRLRDLSGVVADIDPSTLLDDSLAELRDLDPEGLPLVDKGQRLAPCIGGVGKFICVGLNYADHAEESGLPIPQEPVLFMKATSSISGANDAIVAPPGSTKLDWEVELGLIIGKPAKEISENNALDYLAGYCVVNDVSERAFQNEHGGQWTKGKSADSFGPIGPWLVTRDEAPNPQALRLWLDVDGRRFQDGSTSTMIFNVARVVSYVSHFMSLQRGDVISTGTPPGVGAGQKPPIYLKDGQTLRCGIDGLGEQVHKVRVDSPAS